MDAGVNYRTCYSMSVSLRFWPVPLIAAILAVGYATGAHHALSWATLSSHLAEWRLLMANEPGAAALTYVAAYAAVVVASVPGSVWLTIAGGFLFGPAEGTALAVAGAICGAVPLFLAVRHALAPMLARRAAPLLARVRPTLERDGFAGLLALRLLPVLPFWLLNLAPALVGMKLAPFTAATLIGIVPATLVFASIGAGLGDVVASGGTPDLSVILSPRVLLPLAGLVLLSLLPIGWRRWKAANG